MTVASEVDDGAACACLCRCSRCSSRARRRARLLVSVTGVAFGIYDPIVDRADDSDGQRHVRCSNIGQAAWTACELHVALSTGSSGNFPSGALRSGHAALNYNLFRDAGRTQVWGNGTGGSVAGRRGTCASVRARATSHAEHRCTRSTAASRRSRRCDTGIYTDTIVVTLTF